MVQRNQREVRNFYAKENGGNPEIPKPDAHQRGEPADDVSDEEMDKLFKDHLLKVEEWLENQSNMEVKYVNYNEIIDDPAPYCNDINQFLGNTLNAGAMSNVVDTSLHRQKQG